MQGKCLMIVIDGMADRPLFALGGKTPLEVAEIPNMHKIAKEGMCGMLDALGPGKRAGSDTANLAILGYDPYKVYTGRGPIEAAGTGLSLKPEDISLRCNYATINENFTLINRTADYIREDTEALEKVINERINLSDPSVEFIFRNSADYRCVLVLRGDDLSPHVSDVDPEELEKKLLEARPTNNNEEAKKTAALVNEFVKKTYAVLKDHPVNIARQQANKSPANIIMPRGAGKTPVLESFYSKWKLKGACIAGIGLIKGIGYLAGMDIINVKGATGYIDTNYEGKGNVAVTALKDHDFVLLHIEATDEVSHDKDYKAKITALEKTDKMIQTILSKIPPKTLIIILSDHTTSTEIAEHTANPTPIIMWGADLGVFQDFAEKCTEKETSKGMLGRIKGTDVMPIILDLINRSKKFGA
ncbi:MAG: 2,3-bisphosphoglycerate-independent phosphoglycerate mutase [Candidatus Hodarchaeota archaeon]